MGSGGAQENAQLRQWTQEEWDEWNSWSQQWWNRSPHRSSPGTSSLDSYEGQGLSHRDLQPGPTPAPSSGHGVPHQALPGGMALSMDRSGHGLSHRDPLEAERELLRTCLGKH